MFPKDHYLPKCYTDKSYNFIIKGKIGWYTTKKKEQARCLINPVELNPIATPTRDTTSPSQHALEWSPKERKNVWKVESGFTLYYSVDYCKQQCDKHQTSCCAPSFPGYKDGVAADKQDCCDDGKRAYTYNITWSSRGFVPAGKKGTTCQQNEYNLDCKLRACQKPCEWEWTQWAGKCECDCGMKQQERNTRQISPAQAGGVCTRPIKDDLNKRFWPTKPKLGFYKPCPLDPISGPWSRVFFSFFFLSYYCCLVRT